ALLIMGLLTAISSASSSPEQAPVSHRPTPPRHRPPSGETPAAAIERLYAGIPQHGTALGNPGAPVTLQFFGDLECEEARQLVLGALPLLIHHWVRDGELRIVYRPNPEETIWSKIYF